jgi:hypothetical protein
MMLFSTLQAEVKRRALRDQSGTTFDTAVKNVINTSLYRLAREAKWRVLRRESSFDTVTSYTTGTGAVEVTNGSKNVTVTGATFLTNNIQPGRLINLGGSNKVYTIKTITGETTLTVDINYDGTTSTTQSYSIYPQQVYNVPIQASHRIFLWHREWGYPYQLQFKTDQEFYDRGYDDKTTGIPECYRMWKADMVNEQLKAASIVKVSSSSASDTTPKITVFGTVSGYPDFEQVTLTGTTAASGTKSFTAIERVVRDSATVGRVTITNSAANTTVSVIPVGNTTAGIMYRKVSLYPLPTTVFPIQVYYYKDPYYLVNDYDVHELGGDFDEALILLSVAKMKYETSQAEGDRWGAMYKDEVANLRKTNVDKLDFYPTLSKPKDSRGNMTEGAVHPYLLTRQIGGAYGLRVR